METDAHMGSNTRPGGPLEKQAQAAKLEFWVAVTGHSKKPFDEFKVEHLNR